jgi:hypothetical protein
MTQRLKETRLGDRVICEVSGPQIVQVQDETGAMKMTIGWQLLVWLEHERLLGQPPIGVGVPIGGLLPEEHFVETVTTKMLEQARDYRMQAESQLEGPPNAEQVMAMIRAGQGNGQPA